MNKNDKLGVILKADLILSDYTLASDEKERKSLLNLLDNYVVEIDNKKVSIIFDKMTTNENPSEKELYTEILMDIFSNLKSCSYPVKI